MRHQRVGGAWPHDTAAPAGPRALGPHQAGRAVLAAKVAVSGGVASVPSQMLACTFYSGWPYVSTTYTHAYHNLHAANDFAPLPIIDVAALQPPCITTAPR